jgi:PST family polysaccharide transporter
LIRVLGSETYGLIIFSQAIIGYLVILIGFGFNISATKEVSIHKNDNNKLSEIISSVLIIKGTLLILSFICLTFILNFIPSANNYKTLFYLTMWMCIYEFIFPVFYFQGIEKMKYITYLTLISRLIFLGLIFVFIKSESDYLKVPLINGLGAIISGVIAIAILLKEGIKFQFQSKEILLGYLKKSYIMALAYASNTFKLNFNIVVVKFLFSFSEVAYFDLALKILNIGNTFLDIISQTVFPKMSREKDSNFLKKIIMISLFLALIFIVFIQFFGGFIVSVLGGPEMYPAVKLLRVMVLFVPFYITGALLGRNGLIVHGFDKEVLLSMFYSSLFYIIFIMILYFLDFQISLLLIVSIFILTFALESFYRYRICRIKNIF